MSIPTVNKTETASKISSNAARLWVVCCEDTEATQQLSEAIEDWQLPGVRSLSTESLLTHRAPNQAPLSEAIAASDYAIFVTPYSQPCTQVKVSPLDVAHPSTENPHSPAALLGAIHTRHGQSPQSWWLQMPTAKKRAQQVQPVPVQESAAQALDQIGIFIRNYQLANEPKVLNNEAANNKALNSTAKQPAQKVVSSQQQQVVLSHYRRI